MTAPVVAYPDFDKPFILYTDALGRGVKVILYQKRDNGREKLIACASRAFNEHEKKYLIIEQKYLAIV